jgi:hypothetical protein
VNPNPKDVVGRTKPGVSTFPMTALFEGAAATDHGAGKYGPYNWRDDPIEAKEYLNAAMRHVAAWWEGQDLDPESGLPHLAHAIAGLAILRDAQIQGTCIDNRPKASRPGWLGKAQREAREHQSIVAAATAAASIAAAQIDSASGAYLGRDDGDGDAC